MLSTPPPGYNPPSVNRQNVPQLEVPGQQGATALGYPSNPYRSSYALPSSSALPSSVDAPNPYYQQQPMNPAMQMAQLLAKVQ